MRKLKLDKIDHLTPRQIFIELAENAWLHGICNNQLTWAIRKFETRGEPLPDKFLPGRAVMDLPESVREKIRCLKTEDVSDIIPMMGSWKPQRRQRFYRLGRK